MIDDTAMRRNLDDFLLLRDAPGYDLSAQIDLGLGRPLLAVVSGSVLHGLGNPSSDIDLYVVVERDSVSELPISSFDGAVHLDINFLRAEWLREQTAVLTAPRTSPWLDLPDRDAWKAERRRMNQLNRLAMGLALFGDEEWLDWQRTVQRLFPARALAWWRGEAMRYRAAVALLAEDRPLLAAQRLCDAYLLALNAACGAAGELYLVDKWVGVKLRRLGLSELHERFTLAIDTPSSVSAAQSYLDRVGGWFDELADTWGLPEPMLRLTPAHGVAQWRSVGSVLMHRHALRGVEFPRDGVPELPWTGRLEDVPDEHRVLIREGLVWLSIA